LTGIEYVVKDKEHEYAYMKYVSEDSTKKDDLDPFWVCRGAGVMVTLVLSPSSTSRRVQ
jgi:hypothetical protein